MEKKYVYCTNCGTKNSNKDEICKKCKEKIEVKNHLFRDFVYSHTKDKLKSDITDNIFSLISRFLISHLYGTVFVATIIFTGVSAVTLAINTNNKVYTKTKKAPVVATSCHKVNSVNPVLACAKGYELIDGKCLKESTVKAKEKNICKDGYYLKGSKCVSNKTYTTYEKQCIATNENLKQYGLTVNSKNVLETEIFEGTCTVNICGQFIDGECRAGNYEEIGFTDVPVCKNGTTLVDNECRESMTPTKEYSCEDGKLDNNKCIVTEETEPIPTCEEGYVYNEDCNACEVE